MTTTKPKEKTLDEILNELNIKKSDNYVLILWNDDVNSMEHVLISLVEICQLDPQTAFKHTMAAHNTGKTPIKRDIQVVLEKMKKGLNDRGIEATIEKE